MIVDEMIEVVSLCKYPEYGFSCWQDSRGAIYLQGEYDEADTVTGEMGTQVTRRWLLNPFMTKSEIVQTVFKCVITSMEHRVREHFLYHGAPIFGPHYDVDVLLRACAHVDKREQAFAKK